VRGLTVAAPAATASPALADLLDCTADAVASVLAGRSLTDALDGVPAALRPGTQALSFHAMRWLGSARALRERLAPRRPPPPVEALLLVALALLWPAGAPPYATHTLVDQAVACARRRAPRSAAFVNAVLRRFARELPAHVQAVSQGTPQARYNHPAWWVQRLAADWPQHWPAMLACNQASAPMVLRVNARRTDAASYVARLAAAGIEARTGSAPTPQAVVLSAPCAVSALPGFDDGVVSVQDGSAQRAAPLVLGEGADRLHAGARLLDACSAPGGKTAHLLELAELDLLALDSDTERLARVRQTLGRLGLAAQLRVADARDTAAWWDGRPFDAVLLDAPCSASGVVRRHPDARWLRRETDVGALAAVQAQLLDALWPLVKPGGRLVYATCSVFKTEGEAQIDAFTQRMPGAIRRPAPGHLHPLPDNGSQQAAPDAASHDGFFYARLDKNSIH
jgi:16S rRNA (cytosine967-C5)-methyltransferase